MLTVAYPVPVREEALALFWPASTSCRLRALSASSALLASGMLATVHGFPPGPGCGVAPGLLCSADHVGVRPVGERLAALSSPWEESAQHGGASFGYRQSIILASVPITPNL